MRARGERVITQKFIQTGNTGISEDIELHRRIMGIPLQREDLDGTTCRLPLPTPPHRNWPPRSTTGRSTLSLVEKSTGKLLESYDTVLLEGAGGLFVPLTDTYSTIDYIADHRLPVILVTSPRLGSINHTVLSLEACRARNIEVAELVYNLYPPTSREITEDTRRYLKQYINRTYPNAGFTEIGMQDV